MANFKAAGMILEDLTWQQRKRFFWDSKHYIWDDPFLFKIGHDGLLRRCVPKDEGHKIIWHCHDSPCGDNGQCTAAKLLQSGFFWSTLFKDAYNYVKSCDKCQRTENISRRSDMPLKPILEVELFDCWGIDFMRPFPPSYSNMYILVAVDYVSKWIEAIATQKSGSLTIIRFVKKNIFSRFGVPRVLISDGGSHFYNAQLQNVLSKYCVKHKVETPYHPRCNGQAEVSNWEIKKILEKTLGNYRKD